MVLLLVWGLFALLVLVWVQLTWKQVCDGFAFWDDNRAGFELYATRTLRHEILLRRTQVNCIVYILLIQQ